MRRILWIVGLLLALALAGAVEGAGPADDVQTALNSLQNWLGDDANGQRWKTHLRSEELARQAALGDQADRGAVQAILNLYEADTPGLDRPRFVRVREALRRWNSHLAESPTNLPDALRAAKGQARLATPATLAASKSKLQQQLRELERFLSRGDRNNAAAWKRYLKWESMEAELAKEKPSLETLNGSLVQLRGDHEGLELPRFTNARAALRDYMNELLLASTENFSQTFDERAEELARLVEHYPEKPSAEESLALGRAVGWFERSGQIPELTRAIRDKFSHPNVFITASQRFVAAGIQNDVHETQVVRDTILGTRVRATATMSGHVGAQLQPDDEEAALEITLDGSIYSNNVGHTRGVTIYSTGRTAVNAAKRVFISAEGLTSHRATAQASTSTNITGVDHRLAIVEKIAWSRVMQSKAEAERIAAGRAAGRVAGRVDQQAGAFLTEANERFEKRFRAPLLRRDSFPELLAFSSTSDHLLVRARQAGPFQLAAPDAAPAAPDNLDLVARIHQSAVGNFSESLLGGVYLTDERIVELYQENELDVPSDLQLTQDSEPWAITFARTQPIRAEFVDDGVKIAVSCLSLHRGAGYEQVNLSTVDEESNRRFNPEIRIARDYSINLSDGTIKLVAKGDLNVDFIGLNGQPITRYGLLHTSAKSLLTKKFGAMLGARIPREDRQGLELPGRWEKAGTLKARLANAGGGWLSLGWEQAEAVAEPSVAHQDVPPPLQTASTQP